MTKNINGELVKVNNVKELFIDIDNHRLYYETECETIDEAVKEFRSKLRSIRCYTDDMDGCLFTDNFFYGVYMELREWDEDGDYKILDFR